MATPEQPKAPATLSERFLTMLATRRTQAKARERRVVEDVEFLQMLWRQVRALEGRAIERPENLSEIIALVERLAEIPNVAISINSERHQLDPMMGMNISEIARILGMKRQSAWERKKKGDEIMAKRVAASGAVPFSEAKREHAAINAAHEHVAEQLAGPDLSPGAQAARDRVVASIEAYRAKHRAA